MVNFLLCICIIFCWIGIDVYVVVDLWVVCWSRRWIGDVEGGRRSIIIVDRVVWFVDFGIESWI